jgi:hypothetical protein
VRVDGRHQPISPLIDRVVRVRGVRLRWSCGSIRSSRPISPARQGSDKKCGNSRDCSAAGSTGCSLKKVIRSVSSPCWNQRLTGGGRFRKITDAWRPLQRATLCAARLERRAGKETLMISSGYAPNICGRVDLSTHLCTSVQLICAQLRWLTRGADTNPRTSLRCHGRCGRRHHTQWNSCRMFVALGGCLQELRTSGSWADKRGWKAL